MPHTSRLPLGLLGALLILPGACAIFATLPAIGMATYAFGGNPLAGGLFLIATIAIPLGFIAGCWGFWLLARATGHQPAHPPAWLTIATGALLILPLLGLFVFLASGVLPRISGNDRAVARTLMVVSPLLALCGAALVGWQVWKRAASPLPPKPSGEARRAQDPAPRNDVD